MVTTREDIRNWLKNPWRKKPTHMLVVCDTFDYGDYPVYVTRGENIREIVNKYHNQNMQRVMEVYSYKKSLEKQLKERRSWNVD